MPEPLRIHFENLTSKQDVFQIREDLVADLRRRHPDTDALTNVTWGKDMQEMDRWLPEAEVLVTSWDVVMNENFPRYKLNEAAPKLRWLHLTVTGLDKLLPLDWVPGNVTLTNSRGVQSEKGREYALMTLLALHTRLPCFTTSQRKKDFAQIHTALARDRTVCVVGLGNLGGAVAAMARQLGMKVLGVRRTAEPHADVDELFTYEALPEALARADIVFLALPLTPDTRHIIGAREFALMKPGVAIANVGRAQVADYDALMAGLKSGAISCAMLDVFDPEPLPSSSPLWDTPNLIMTPHVGVDDLARFIPTTLELMFGNVTRYLAGEPLRNVVNRKLGY